MNVFHIAALQPNRDRGPELPSDGMYGNGYRQAPLPMPQGARGRGGDSAQNDTTSLTSMVTPYLRKYLQMRLPPANFAGLPAKLAGDPCTKRHLPPAKLAGDPGRTCGGHPHETTPATRTKRHYPPAKTVTLYRVSERERESYRDFF